MDICDELEAKASTVHGGAYSAMHKARKEIIRLRAALELAQKDAGRLDWFADHIISIEDDCRISATWRIECDRGCFRGDSIRAAIDAAMASLPQSPAAAQSTP